MDWDQQAFMLLLSEVNMFSPVLRSSDNGNTWSSANNGITNNLVGAMVVSGKNIYVGTYGGKVFLSTDDGENWAEISNGIPGSANISALTVSGTNIYAGSGEGVFLSTDNGENWTLVNNGLTNPSIRGLAATDNAVFAGSYGGGVYLSTDDGATWTDINTGLGNPLIGSLIVSGTDVIAGTDSGGAWRRPLSEVVSASSIIASGDMVLHQNNPNPFTSTTRIKFEISNTRDVKLSVCNMLGHEVATLINGQVKSGLNEVVFDASNIPGGTYFYKLYSGNQVVTGKMILIK
jgi:hypothetical protein